MRIIVDDLTGPEIAALLRAHVEEMHTLGPPESTHALDLDALRAPEVTFWSVVDGGEVVGCGALKELGGAAGEIKSMRTAAGHTGRGVGSRLLTHILGAARERGLTRLSLETGSGEFFAPARRLYQRHGFVACEPFGPYVEDPNSVYLTLDLPCRPCD